MLSSCWTSNFGQHYILFTTVLIVSCAIFASITIVYNFTRASSRPVDRSNPSYSYASSMIVFDNNRSMYFHADATEVSLIKLHFYGHSRSFKRTRSELCFSRKQNELNWNVNELILFTHSYVCMYVCMYVYNARFITRSSENEQTFIDETAVIASRIPYVGHGHFRHIDHWLIILSLTKCHRFVKDIMHLD